MSTQLDPRHDEKQKLLRVLGPAFLCVGVVFLIIGVTSFFMAFGTMEFPHYFWCAFVGIPLIGVGSWLMSFGYMGAVTRYMAGEVAPVGKDVMNYTVEGTKGSVKDLAAAIGEGFRTGSMAADTPVVFCQKCGAKNLVGANYCSACGNVLSKDAAS